MHLGGVWSRVHVHGGCNNEKCVRIIGLCDTPSRNVVCISSRSTVLRRGAMLPMRQSMPSVRVREDGMPHSYEKLQEGRLGAAGFYLLSQRD